jgi:hypothetical protein
MLDVVLCAEWRSSINECRGRTSKADNSEYSDNECRAKVGVQGTVNDFPIAWLPIAARI